jgi:tape measure domain-containing protein
MKGMMTGLAGIFAARELVTMADTWSDVSARVGIAVGEMSDAPAVMERLYNLAQDTYSGFQQTAESFVANSTALKELGYNTNQQLDYTEALNNALVVSGAKGDRATSVTNALSKAMAAGKLSGDGLNTIIETGGRVAEVLAAELGVGVNALRDVGAQGKITSQVIYSALTKRMEDLAEQAGSMPATIGDAFQQIQNAALKSVGALDQTGKVTEKLSGLLGGVAKNMDTVAVAGIAMAAAFGGATNRGGNYQFGRICPHHYRGVCGDACRCCTRAGNGRSAPPQCGSCNGRSSGQWAYHKLPPQREPRIADRSDGYERG